MKFLNRLTVAILVSGFVNCDISSLPKPKHARTFPPDVAASLYEDCFAETHLKLACRCYQWNVQDRWTFGQISMGVAADRNMVLHALNAVYQKCLRDNPE